MNILGINCFSHDTAAALLQDGEPVAAALNLIGREALYGRNWGSDGAFKFLHFEACYYQAIDFAIERGLARVEAGAQGEHKIARGYLPVERRFNAARRACVWAAK